MAMPGRTYAAPGSLDDKYRYSHNGQEKDNDIFIGALSAEYWEYDSRTGRRWENDPIRKPWESPYATFANSPIWYSDVNGLDAKPKGDKKDSGNTKKDKGKSKKDSKNKADEQSKDKAKDKGNQEKASDPDYPLNHEGNDVDLDEVPIVAERSPAPKDNTNVTQPTVVDPNNKPKSSGYQPSAMEIVAYNLRRFDNWMDHHHDEVSSKPIETSLWGFQQTGDGGNRNVYFYGYPSHNDYSYTPGSNLGPGWEPGQSDSYILSDVTSQINYTIKYVSGIVKNTGNAMDKGNDIYKKTNSLIEENDKASLTVPNDKSNQLQIIRVHYMINNSSDNMVSSETGQNVYAPGDTVWKETTTQNNTGNKQTKIKVWKPRK